ncbi:MAG: dihydrodipicolinate synthase family protein, partial [Pseudomonadales bacterium]|nr:dihydrodipicolinate synthase family protein [Pseudomonadales bacterium]
RTACDMSLETVNRLADLENIVGIKDATGDILRGHELVQRCGDRLKVYRGEDAITLALMEGGADGTISVTANVIPSLMAEMCGLALAGDFAAAAEVDSRLALLHQNLFLEANPIPVKWALAKMGLIAPGIRLPLVELDVKYHVQVKAALEQAGVSFPEAA